MGELLSGSSKDYGVTDETGYIISDEVGTSSCGIVRFVPDDDGGCVALGSSPG